jgi:hypothetical protein
LIIRKGNVGKEDGPMYERNLCFLLTVEICMDVDVDVAAGMYVDDTCSLTWLLLELVVVAAWLIITVLLLLLVLSTDVLGAG